MRRSTLKAIAALSAAAVMISACPQAAYAETKTAAQTSSVSFDANAYCTIRGTVNKNNVVTVTWGAVAGADSYSLYRDDGSGFRLAATTKSRSYTDKKAKTGNCYRYKVYAVKGGQKSASSEVLHVGLPKNGKAVTYTFDVPVDYEARNKLTAADFDIYDNNDYSGAKPKPKKPVNKVVYTETTVDYDYEEEYEEAVYEEASYDDADYAAPEAPAGAVSEDYDADGDMAFRPPKRRYHYSGNEEDIKAGTLTAGRLEDNRYYSEYEKAAETDEWLDLADTWGLGLGDRYTVKVTDGSKGVENTKVQLMSKNGRALYTARTNNSGLAYVFTGLARQTGAESIRVTSPDGSTEDVKISDIKNRYCTVNIGSTAAKKKTLDLMLTIDSTGSMSDEMRYLEAELKDVVKRVSKDNKNIDIRICVNFYRDKGDAYIVRSYKFRTSADTVTKSLGFERATGGGDYPEAVHTALDVAVNKCGWQEDSTKIMFMVLDAPPHEDNTVAKEIKDRVREASEKGIRIVPVVSSGSDDETEYILRTMAVATGGTYLFLTDDSGVGNSHAEPKADQYEVRKLNDLMVDVIDEYLK